MDYCGKNNVLDREGSDQSQRFIRALDPTSVELNQFSLKEWMRFAFQFATRVNYFGEFSEEEPNGNWQSFFKSDKELDGFISRVGNENTIPPHLALFICFVWLLEYSKKRFNRLTRRHLDFYYREILHIQKQPATPDKVHLIFELAKKAAEAKVDEGTGVDGGKDANGQKRVYEVTEELIVNQAAITQLKNVYNDHASGKIKAALMANSYDGRGKDFPEGEAGWWPFGSPEGEDAKLGFAVASPVLKLREGDRTIQLDIKLATPLVGVTSQLLIDNLEVWCSGEKGWLGPYTPLDTSSTGVSESSTRLKIAFTIPRDEAAVVPYNATVHGEHFDTDQPVCRVLIRTSNIEGHTLYRHLIDKEINNLSIHIDARGIKSLELENDIGQLNASKPFYPFGTQPVKQSNFYIGYPELFEKEWQKIGARIEWKNTPEKTGTMDAFMDLYYAYRTTHRFQSSTTKYLTALYIQLFDKTTGEPISWGSLDTEPANLLVRGDDHFKADIEVKHKEEWEITSEGRDRVLFMPEEDGFISEFEVENTRYERGKNGPLRVSLNQSFHHELYPRIYALAFASDKKDALIPNAPYTPMIESISLDYTASASMNLKSSSTDYHENRVALFHEHPFGQAEEHAYWKRSLGFLNEEERRCYLVPTYCKGGELYIGLAGAELSRTVSLLIQLQEGSENPEAEAFTGKQKVAWSVLCRDHWMPLDSRYMIANETPHFLKSGIVKFALPKEADSNNTRLAPGLIWIKASIYKSHDAVSKAIAIHAQAAVARLVDHGEEWAHLQNGLEANSITKLLERVSPLKGPSQPYPSFGGKPRESDSEQYRRVSERLRHKNRAITLWDYEHLVLQQFPEIFKVKCINHSAYRIKQKADGAYESTTRSLAPGHVLVVVIPDIVNHRLFDLYQPRVSKAKIAEIEAFLNERSGMHVKTVVINPEYEEVTVDLQVRFHKGFDEHFYLRRLNEDITRVLSPHAFRETARIEFGATLHRSTLIHWIEKLPYVDWVKEVKLVKGGNALTRVSPSTPVAILVSAREHRLALASGDCEESIENVEVCQK